MADEQFECYQPSLRTTGGRDTLSESISAITSSDASRSIVVDAKTSATSDYSLYDAATVGYYVVGTSAMIAGDSLTALKALPDATVQTIVTSPPYWSLRDYGIVGQIGLVEDLDDYVNALADIFDEAFRVLKDDGTLWLNIGDSYTSGNRKWRAPDKKNPARAMSMRPPTPDGLKDKDLIGIPWRIAFELQKRGWYLRSEVVWRKPNCQPESVKDRPTREHEQVFLFSKSERYYYDVKAVKGPNGRRLRTVWDINTKPNKLAKGHFATFPYELVERCIKITSRAGDIVMDPFMGSGTTALVSLDTSRKFLGIELNPSYVEMTNTRLVEAGYRASADKVEEPE